MKNDISIIRKDFPIFSHHAGREKPFCYLDSTATSLKPKVVVDAMREYYEEYSANIHRGVYAISEEATEKYEEARERIRRFINAPRKEEIIFVRNATEALNLLAYSYAEQFLNEGEGVLVSEMEHHANLVPWQELAKRKNIKLYFLPFHLENGVLEWDEGGLVKFLKEKKIKIVSLVHVSNVLGTINPLEEIGKRVHEAGAVFIADACQSVPHLSVDVANLGADFLVFSGHKMLGPTGIGVLWGRYELLEKMPPFLTGGDMIQDVMLERSTFQNPPQRFEAGTPHVAGAIGLGAAVDYLQGIGMEALREHEKELLTYAMENLSALPNIKILGPRDIEKRSGAIAFVFSDIHPHDVGGFLAEEGVMIRVGDHCAKPLHRKFKIPASSRISVYLYNDREDIERAAEALQKMIKTFT